MLQGPQHMSQLGSHYQAHLHPSPDNPVLYAPSCLNCRYVKFMLGHWDLWLVPRGWVPWSALGLQLSLAGSGAASTLFDFGLEGFAIEKAIAAAQKSIESVYSGSRQSIRMRSKHENWFRSHFLLQREAVLTATPRQQLGIVHSFLQVKSLCTWNRSGTALGLLCVFI